MGINKKINSPGYQYSSFLSSDPFSLRFSQSIFPLGPCFPISSHHTRRFRQFIDSLFLECLQVFLIETVPRSTLLSVVLGFTYLILSVCLNMLLFYTSKSPTRGRISILFKYFIHSFHVNVMISLLSTLFALMREFLPLVFVTAT